MANDITEQLTPATLKTMKLKQKVKELYLEVGYPEDQAEYHMLCDAGEYS